MFAESQLCDMHSNDKCQFSTNQSSAQRRVTKGTDYTKLDIYQIIYRLFIETPTRHFQL